MIKNKEENASSAQIQYLFVLPDLFFYFDEQITGSIMYGDVYFHYNTIYTQEIINFVCFWTLFSLVDTAKYINCVCRFVGVVILGCYRIGSSSKLVTVFISIIFSTSFVITQWLLPMAKLMSL